MNDLWIFDPIEVSFVTKKLSDIITLKSHHCRSFQTKSPGNNRTVWRKAHWNKHFRSENPRISNLNDFLQLRVISEYFHWWLSVRVVGGFEFDVCDSYFVEKRLDKILQLRKPQSLSNNQPFYLVKFSQMGRVQCFVSENSVNGEIFSWYKITSLLIFLSNSIQSSSRHSSGMSS